MPSLKPGVCVYPPLHPVMDAAIEPIDRAHVRVIGRCGIMTSGRDGTHSVASFHYSGRALDYRSNDIPDLDKKLKLVRALQDALGPEFVVLLEKLGRPDEHIHIHWKGKKPDG